MPEHVKLKYHQATLDLLGRKPALSHAALKKIEEAEKQAHLKLPASIREWYSLAAFKEISHEGLFRLHGLLRELLKLGEDMKRGYYQDSPPTLQLGRYEGDDHFWGIFLDGSDDPRVFNIRDSVEMLAVHFSEFMFKHAWWKDHPLSWPEDLILEAPLIAHNQPFGPPHFDFMMEHYRAGLPHLVEGEQCRIEDFSPLKKDSWNTFFPFWNAHGRIVVQCSHDPSQCVKPAKWGFFAETADALAMLLVPLKPFAGLMRALRVETSEGKEALAQLSGKPAAGKKRKAKAKPAEK